MLGRYDGLQDEAAQAAQPGRTEVELQAPLSRPQVVESSGDVVRDAVDDSEPHGADQSQRCVP